VCRSNQVICDDTMHLLQRLSLLRSLTSRRFYSVPPAVKIQPRLQLTITCTAPACETKHRSTHSFSRLAYEKGIVLVQCPACSTRHRALLAIGVDFGLMALQ
jgi:hypothetical protein